MSSTIFGGYRMKRMEITLRIEKQKAIVKKYNVVSGIIGYCKLLLIALVILSLYFTFVRGLPLLVTVLGVLAAVFAWTYHDWVRRIIINSNDIITMSKDQLDRLASRLTPLTEEDALMQYVMGTEPGSMASFADYVEYYYAKKSADSAALDPDEVIKERGGSAYMKSIRFLLM